MDTGIYTFINEENNLPLYMKAIGGTIYQGQTYRPYGLNDHQWLHCMRGKGKLIVDNKEFIITKNSGFYLAPETQHEYFPLEEPWETHWVVFSGYDTSNLLNLLGFKSYGVFSFDDIKFLDGILTDIFYTAKTSKLASGFRCSGKLYHFLMELKNTIKEDSLNMDHALSQKVQAVINYIENNYNKNPTLDEMAAVIQTSPQYLCRIFKQTYNIRPFAFLTKYRLQKSKEMLIHDLEANIEEIAKKVGYQDGSYFCATFKKYEGYTPTEFRRMGFGESKPIQG